MALTFGFSSSVAVSTGNLAKRRDPYLGHNFLVEIDGIICGGFSQVQGLGGSIEVEDHAEGGVNGYVNKVLKAATYPNLVLMHGLTDLDGLWRWFDDTRNGLVKRRSGTIMLLDDTRLPIMWWDFHDAIPIRWTGPSLDAARDGQVAIESVELVHRGITKPALSSVTSAARGASEK
jgi:phage tail-like protein